MRHITARSSTPWCESAAASARHCAGSGWDVAESGANFILARPPLSTTAVDVAAHLRAERILVRHFDTPGLGDRLRISIGDRTATDRVLAAVSSMQPRSRTAAGREIPGRHVESPHERP